MKKFICLILAIAYTLFPVDLSTLYGCPDVVPVLGWIDDGVIDLILAFIAFRRGRVAQSQVRQRTNYLVR